MEEIYVIQVDRSRMTELMCKKKFHTENTQSILIVVEFPKYDYISQKIPSYTELNNDTNTPIPITFETKVIESIGIIKEFSYTSDWLTIPDDAYEIETVYSGILQFIKEIINVDYREKVGIELPESVMNEITWYNACKLSITIENCKYVCDNYFIHRINGGFKYENDTAKSNSACVDEG